MSKYTLFHDFFHNPEARGSYSGCNVSFDGDKFYSYSTIIGQKIKAGKRDILAISSNTMSITTTMHLSKLRRACPYPAEHIVYVPFAQGDHYSYLIASLQSRFEDQLIQMLTWKLTQWSCRYKAESILCNYAKFRALFKVKKFKPADKLAKIIAEVEAKRNRPVDPVKAEKRKLAKERQIAKIREGCKDWTYMDKVKFLAGKVYTVLPSETKCKLTEALRNTIMAPIDGNRPSFVWVDGDQVMTSQHVKLPIAIVKRAIATWRAKGADAVGNVGVYHLDEVADSYMKIGCHYIPMENILALEKELA